MRTKNKTYRLTFADYFVLIAGFLCIAAGIAILVEFFKLLTNGNY